MKKDYKVHADKIHKYTAIIEAESPEIAWEHAKEMSTNVWQEVPSDDPIEPYNVEEV